MHNKIDEYLSLTAAPNLDLYEKLWSELRGGIYKNNLLARYPLIAQKWHPTKNGNLTPEMVRPGSKTKIWLRCEKHNEEWYRQVCIIVRYSIAGSEACRRCRRERDGTAALYDVKLLMDMFAKYGNVIKVAKVLGVVEGSLRPKLKEYGIIK